MDPKTILKRIEEYKKELTWPHHQRAIENWEKNIRTSVIRSKLGEQDAVKGLIKQLEIKIEHCNFLLLHNRELTVEERKLVFEKRDIFGWFISFFKDAKQTLKSAEKFAKTLKSK